jgi:hypothetical protein
MKPPVVITCPWQGPAVVNPTELPACDNGGCTGAHCLPSAVVPLAEAGMLAICGSGSTAGYCTPDTFIVGGGESVPSSCKPFAGSGEGRCLSACIPQIAAQAGQLQEVTCSSNELCAPCADPFTGASTGACTTACDKPAQPPFTFPGCCTGAGLPSTCVPTYEVPSSQASSLNQDVCPNNFSCVPDEYLPAPHNAGHPIWTCTGPLGGAAACVNDCAVNIPTSWLFGQGSCPNGYKCVSCTLSSIFGVSPPGC